MAASSSSSKPTAVHFALIFFVMTTLILAVVAFLVLLNQVLVQPPIMEMTTDAPTINVAGRQRMLSQRLAKAALALDRAVDDADRRRHRAELEQVLRLWSASHTGLRHGDRGD